MGFLEEPGTRQLRRHAVDVPSKKLDYVNCVHAWWKGRDLGYRLFPTVVILPCAGVATHISSFTKQVGNTMTL